MNYLFQVNSKWTVGDGQGAQRAAAQSRQFSMIAIGIGIAAYVICAIIVGVYIGILSQYWY
jgi:F0F1-type ATP synthase assembly protein I